VLSVAGRTGEPVLYDEAKVRERWGVEPGQIADVLALMGDTIDNIKGVRGVGEKTAVKLIAQYGSVDRLYENLTLIPGKLRETLAAGRKDALLSRELALLNRQVPVAVDLDAFRRVEPDWAKLRQLWMEMEFTRLVKELPPPPPQAPPEPSARLDGAGATELSSRAGLHRRARRVSSRRGSLAGVRRAGGLRLALLGTRGRRAQSPRALADLRGDRAPPGPGAGAHGAPWDPGRSSTPG